MLLRKVASSARDIAVQYTPTNNKQAVIPMKATCNKTEGWIGGKTKSNPLICSKKKRLSQTLQLLANLRF